MMIIVIEINYTRTILTILEVFGFIMGVLISSV